MARIPPGAARSGERPDLFAAVYDELRALARRYLSRERRNHTWQPTALVHEAWFRLREERRVPWNGRTHVLAVGAQAMQRLLIDHGRGQKRLKRGGGAVATTLHDGLNVAHGVQVSVADALAVSQAIARLRELDPRQAAVVELRYFGGLTVAEVAAELGMAVRTVEGEWTHAKAWLRQQLDPEAR
ncbi:MAG: sigma-70 family RNA polymerase sigma factor [Acidobacteria bacterium]|nr:sigma-70 family RNA polymerase sigma factor [Acidobacteriota bacterium]